VKVKSVHIYLYLKGTCSMHGLDDYSEKLHSLLVLNKLHLTVI